MKRIGFLSFGHWTPSSQSQTRSASDAVLQSIDLADAAEELGADGVGRSVGRFPGRSVAARVHVGSPVFHSAAFRSALIR